MISTLILVSVAGLAKACADTFMADKRWEDSIFNRHYSHKHVPWLPGISWNLWFGMIRNSCNNKYAWKGKNKILNWLFANPLSFMTDGWHMCQFICNNALLLAAFGFTWTFLIAAIVFHTMFILFYDKFLIK